MLYTTPASAVAAVLTVITPLAGSPARDLLIAIASSAGHVFLAHAYSLGRSFGAGSFRLPADPDCRADRLCRLRPKTRSRAGHRCDDHCRRDPLRHSSRSDQTSRTERRRNHSAVRMIAVIKTRSTVETAASSGLTFSTASSHICFGRVALSPPVVNNAIVSSSKETMKAKRKAEMIPGRIRGSVTFHRVRTRLAPSVAAAWSRRSS